MSRPTPSRNLTLTEELEKLEQSITLTLQEIDHNFSKAHRIVTTNILPLVEQYGEHSKNVWEASKFWKQFFEASANVSLSGYEELANNEDTTVANETTRLTDVTTMSEDREGEAVNESAAEELSYNEPLHRRDVEDSLLDDGSLAGSTPRLPATKSLRGEQMQMANFGSPYENLRRELKDGPDDGSHTPKSDVFGEGMDVDETAQQLQQTRFPEMDMTSNSSMMETTPTRDIRTNLFGTGGKGKGNSKDPLLHQLLNKNYRIQATPHKTTTQFISPNKGRAPGTDKSAKARWQDSPMSSPEIAAPTLRTNLYNATSPLKQQRGRLGAGATRLEPPRTPGVSVQTPATGRKTRDVFAEEGTSKSKGKGKADPDEITWESDEDDDSAMFGGMSPPKTIQFALPPSKLMQTPAKEASKRIVDDILLTAGAAPEYEDDLEDFSPTMVKMSHNILDDTF